MQNSLSFSWGQVAQRIYKHVDPVRSTSLKDKFELFADPCAFLLIHDHELQDRIGKLCNQIGASVVGCDNIAELLQKVASSSALCPTICIVDGATNHQTGKQIAQDLDGHFSSCIFQLTEDIDNYEDRGSAEVVTPKPIELPINKDAFTSAINEFLIMASQLAGHLRRIRKLESLNEREKILIQLISFGVPNKSSASILKLAEKTVEKCRTGVYRKLDVRSTGELASLVTMANFYRWPTGARVPYRTAL